MEPMTPEITAAIQLPEVPLTVEGASVLHQMMRFRWSAWRDLAKSARSSMVAEAAEVLSSWEKPNEGQQSGIFSLLGHKGDLMLVHFRRTFEELNQAQTQLSRLELSDYLEPTGSYVSIVELGLYESSTDTYASWRGGISSRTPRSGNVKSKRCWIAIVRPWRRACGRRFRPPSTSVSIRWIGDGASRRTGIRKPWRIGSA